MRQVQSVAHGAPLSPSPLPRPPPLLPTPSALPLPCAPIAASPRLSPTRLPRAQLAQQTLHPYACFSLATPAPLLDAPAAHLPNRRASASSQQKSHGTRVRQRTSFLSLHLLHPPPTHSTPSSTSPLFPQPCQSNLYCLRQVLKDQSGAPALSARHHGKQANRPLVSPLSGVTAAARTFAMGKVAAGALANHRICDASLAPPLQPVAHPCQARARPTMPQLRALPTHPKTSPNSLACWSACPWPGLLNRCTGFPGPSGVWRGRYCAQYWRRPRLR